VRMFALVAAVVLSVASFSVIARGSHSSGHHSSGGHRASSPHHVGSGTHRSANAHRTASGARKAGRAQRFSNNRAALAVQHDSRGRIKRSSGAKTEFKKSQPCPSTGKSSGTCPGYVIDHVKALERGGADAPRNMQWQTVKDAKAKDRTE